MTKLFFREINETQNPQAATLIILHGFLGSCDNWLTVSKQLATYFRIFLVDQRNHGRSEWAATQNYEAMAADLKDFIAMQNLQNPIILGHSMGGKTVMQFAAKYPDLFSKMLVVDISPKKYVGNHEQILNGLNAINLETLSNRAEADTILVNFEPDLGVRQFLLKNLYKTENDKFAWRMNLKVLAAEYDNILEEIKFEQPLLKPVYFIRGGKSNYISDKEIPNLQLLFPKMQLKTIENAGHWLQAEQPQAFIDTLLSFEFDNDIANN